MFRKCDICGSDLDFEDYCTGNRAHEKIRELQIEIKELRIVPTQITPVQFGGASTENKSVHLTLDYGSGDNDYVIAKMSWEKAEELLEYLSMLLGKGD